LYELGCKKKEEKEKEKKKKKNKFSDQNLGRKTTKTPPLHYKPSYLLLVTPPTPVPCLKLL